ncbi:MAG: carbohydrate ABC transporter permease [Blastochloris sp.]|nr:carbohydrate ABC transporter permease [Blastochloris sp.]
MSSAQEISYANAQKKRDFPKHLIIWFVLAIELLPFYMMVQMSVKTNQSFIANPWFPNLPNQWHLENWVHGFNLIFPYIANTVFVAVTGTFGMLALAILASYFFARYKMPCSTLFWSLLMVIMLLPGVANLVPLFQLLKSMNLLNSLWALIILAIAGGQVFCIFILRNFIEEIPRDLFEAAEMDGATHLQQIMHVVIPMSGPIIGTLSILTFLGIWNDFMMPLILLRDQDLFTLGVGLVYLDGEYVKDYGQIMAAFLVASIPIIIIFLFCMKLFVRGLSSGAIKG